MSSIKRKKSERIFGRILSFGSTVCPSEKFFRLAEIHAVSFKILRESGSEKLQQIREKLFFAHQGVVAVKKKTNCKE